MFAINAGNIKFLVLGTQYEGMLMLWESNLVVVIIVVKGHQQNAVNT